MKALAVKSPYAENIAIGKKTFEIRTWKPAKLPMRDVVICCSKNPVSHVSGFAICVVDIVEVLPFTPDLEENSMVEWFEGDESFLFAWRLENVRVIQPFHPSKGKLGFFDITIEKKSEIFVADAKQLLSFFPNVKPLLIQNSLF